MPVKVLMPALSPTMTAGNLSKWIKKQGDKIKPGDVIAEIETDKATMEVESVDEGILAKVIIAEGSQNVNVGSLIAVILEDGESDKELENFITSNQSQNLESKESTASVVENAQIVNIEPQSIVKPQTSILSNHDINHSRILASPLARRIAKDRNLNLELIEGSGPYGRIVKQDVENANIGHKNFNSINRHPSEYNIVPHSNIRKIIAARLVESKQTVPHFYLNIECDLNKLLDIRADINDLSDTKSKISVNDMIIKAVALALKDVPHANATWSESGILFYNNIDVSVAVAIDGGLITPVIRNADQKSLFDLSGEMKSLAQKARENKLRPEEFQGGGFTISNLGMYGIKRFSAIINPPQSCILAVGEATKRPIVENDQIVIKTIVDVTLSCDHRVVDGAVGAQFLKAFKRYIEKPSQMLI